MRSAAAIRSSAFTTWTNCGSSTSTHAGPERLFLPDLRPDQGGHGLAPDHRGMQANTVEDVEAQDELLREAEEKIDRLRCAADMLISAEFQPGRRRQARGKLDKAWRSRPGISTRSDRSRFRASGSESSHGSGDVSLAAGVP